MKAWHQAGGEVQRVQLKTSIHIKVEEPKIVRISLATKLDFNVFHSVFLTLIFFSLERQDDLKLNPS
jgi:hypothetical protein